MKIWSMFKPGTVVKSHGNLAPETMNAITAVIADKKDLISINKMIAKLPGDENTIISIYHNSKRTFITAPGQSKKFIDSYIGTFASYTNKMMPNKPPVEVKLSDKHLPINKDVLNLIV